MKAKLGTGARFAAMVRKLKGRGAEDPSALAAWIGRKRYGKKKFQQMAMHGRREA